MRTLKKAVFDIEADGLLDTVTRMWCLVLKDLDTGEVYKFSEEWSMLWEQDALTALSQYDLIIGHNIIGYDLKLLEKLYKYKFKGQVLDTLILSRTFDPDRAGGHGLEPWGRKLKRLKPEHEDWSQFSPEMLHRCTEDVELNTLLYKVLCKEGSLDYNDPWNSDSPWIPCLKLEHKVSYFVADMTEEGFPVDRDVLVSHITYLREEMDKIEAKVLPDIPKKVKAWGKPVSKPFKINRDHTKQVKDWWGDDSKIVRGPHTRIIFEEINLGSDKQVKEFLLSIGWQPTEWNYKKVTEKESKDKNSPYYRQAIGKEARDRDNKKVKTSPKLTEDSYASLPDQGLGADIAMYLKLKHRRSLLEGILNNIRDDGRVGQQITGLASTGRYKHAVIVNIPGKSFFGHEIRSCFTSTDGYSLIGTDASSCQLRMLAHYMGDEDYVRTVTEGEEFDDKDIYQGTDIHTINGIRAGLINSADVLRCKGCHSDAMPDCFRAVDFGRSQAKTFIYGLLFGAGDPKIAAGLGCSVKQASKVRQTFLKSLPALKTLLDRLTRTYDRRGYLIGFDGRKIRPRGDHMLLVYLLQTAEAVYMKTAWCFLENYIKRSNLDARAVAFVHDEFQYLVKQGQEEEFQKLAREAFVKAGTYFKLNCPTDGNPKVGVNWRETH